MNREAELEAQVYRMGNQIKELTEDKSEASPCNECTLTARVAELEGSEAALSLVLEQQDRTLSRHREALEQIAHDGNETASRALYPHLY